MHFTAWTDGGCEPNPGNGGWGVVLIDEATRQQSEYFGGELNSTNNRMELKAIIEALKLTPKGAEVLIHSDSQLCVNTCSTWMHKWQSCGWRKANKKPVANLELVKEAYDLVLDRVVTFKWVRAHFGIVLNERADCLAAQGIIALIGEHEYNSLRRISSLRY
jgi:ribonuclease HI